MSNAVNKLIQAAAGNAGEAVYVDDVFSTFLYTGTGSTETIINNIDLAGEGGLVWNKKRTYQDNYLHDTENGTGKRLISNGSGAAQDIGVSSFNNNGFSLAASSYTASGGKYVTWTFRKQPGFFDIVTYTGDGTTSRDINHNLGSAPGAIIIKSTDNNSDWTFQHRYDGNYVQYLNSTAARSDSGATLQFNSTNFKVVGPPSGLADDKCTNVNGATYVAYIFAHDAQDFGTDSDEAIIKCGSYTGNGSSDGPTIDLGFEPQWIIWKRADSGTESWHIRDVMRGMPTDAQLTASGKDLYADSGSAEGNTTNEGPIPTANGFKIVGTNTNGNASGGTYIYVAIRRPHKPAEEFAATDLFKVNNPNTAGDTTFYSGFPVGMSIRRFVGVSDGPYVASRLGGPLVLLTSSNAAQSGDASSVFDNNEGWALGWGSDATHYSWMFRRAPGFFDVVAYAGDGVNGRALPHNLGVAPEMIWAKNRGTTNNWVVWHSALNITTESLILNADTATGVPASATTGWFTQAAASTNIYPVNYQGINSSGDDYIAYLFASVSGISKVGSYTGTGNDLNVDCGFSAGARLVLIKRSDSSGDWYLWDSVRGIVAGDDPYLFLNSTAAQVTNTDYIDPLSSGFTVTSSAPAALNNSGGTYIFYAIA